MKGMINREYLKDKIGAVMRKQIKKKRKCEREYRKENDFNTKLEIDGYTKYHEGFIDALTYVYYRLEEYDDEK